MNILNLPSPMARLTGRIPETNGGVMLCWCGSSITFKFRGTKCSVKAVNDNFGSETIVGSFIDGKEYQYKIPYGDSGKEIEIVLADDLREGEHVAVFYKRMEGHYITVREITCDGEFFDPPKAPKKRIEVYGDSVSAGSVVDCEEYVGKSDPEHKGQWDNAWHAYPQILARELPAEVYDTAQGGIAIFDGTGYFEMPDTKGMESCWEYSAYSSYRERIRWDFGFKPHVIIFAIGQNDAYPDPDVLKDPERREKWISKYIEIIEGVRSHSPKAAVVLALTVLMHDPAWDEALSEIANRLGGEGKHVYHYLYTRCGKATPGHPRYPEQREMAAEMKAFLTGLPEEIWA